MIPINGHLLLDNIKTRSNQLRIFFCVTDFRVDFFYLKKIIDNIFFHKFKKRE